MPESACLHIQANDTDPVRVVTLSGGSVRIGRAAYCDVRLPDATLAAEECRLRRRGDAWQLVPAESSTSVWLDDRAVDRPLPLANRATFRVGGHRLTLVPASPTTAAAERAPVIEAVARVAAPSPAPEPSLQTVRPSHAEPHERWLESRRGVERWESRWRAVGETLRAAGDRPAPATGDRRPRPSPEAGGERTRRADLLRESFARRSAVSPPEPVVPTAPARPPGMAPAPTPAAGYISPAAPAAPREPARTADWRHAPAPARVAPAATVRAARAASAPAAPAVTPPEPATEPVAPAPETAPTERALEAVIGPVEPTPAPEAEPVPVAAEVRDVDHLSRFDAVFADAPPVVPVEEAVPAADEPEPPAVAPTLGVVTATLPVPAGPIEEDETFDESPDFSRRLVLGTARRVARVDRPHAQAVPPPFFPVPEPTPAGDGWTGPERVARRRGVRSRQVARQAETPEGPEGARSQGGPGVVRERVAPKPAGAAATRPATATATARESARPGARPRPPRRERPAADVRAEAAGAVATEAVSSRDWPSVRDILAAQGARPKPAAPKAATNRARRPAPTAAREPGSWRVPLWLGWVPATAAAVGVGVAGMAGSWTWARDAYQAGEVARRLAGPGTDRTPLPEGVSPGDGAWWTTTAAHLAHWAAFLDRDGGDPSNAAEARALLERAAQASPLNATVRYALARPLPGETLAPPEALARSLGQSRDVLSLSWAGHQLLASGKKDAALMAYRGALAMAAEPEPAGKAAPAFLDDPQARRYALPTEDRLAAVVRDMAGSPAWTYSEWAEVLPRGTAAALVAARVLRETGGPGAEAALAEAVAEAESGPPRGANGGRAGESIRLAAGAAALAMSQRWAEARDRYTAAIELHPDDNVRRSWWLNVAQVESRLNEETARQKALELAKNTDPKDEITQRAVESQKQSGYVAQRSPVDRAVETASGSVVRP